MEAWYNIEDAIVKVKMVSYDVFGPIVSSSSTIRPITIGVWMTFLVNV